MSENVTINGVQCRGARAMLGWSRPRLAREAKVAERTVIDFERGARNPQASTLDAIQRALEAGGVRFTNGDEPGVKIVS